MAAGCYRAYDINVFSSELLGNKCRTLEFRYAAYLSAGFWHPRHPAPAFVRSSNGLAVFQDEKGAREVIDL